jgi:hypothetical protein
MGAGTISTFRTAKPATNAMISTHAIDAIGTNSFGCCTMRWRIRDVTRD